MVSFALPAGLSPHTWMQVKAVLFCSPSFANRVKNFMRVRRRSCQDNRSRHDSHAGYADQTGSFQFLVFVFLRPRANHSSKKHVDRRQ